MREKRLAMRGSVRQVSNAFAVTEGDVIISDATAESKPPLLRSRFA